MRGGCFRLGAAMSSSGVRRSSTPCLPSEQARHSEDKYLQNDGLHGRVSRKRCELSGADLAYMAAALLVKAVFPNLFIIGAMKAGTSSLHEYLHQHPQIFMSRFKEPQYFAPHRA